MALTIKHVELTDKGLNLKAGAEEPFSAVLSSPDPNLFTPLDRDCPPVLNQAGVTGIRVRPENVRIENPPSGWYQDEPTDVCKPLTQMFIHYMVGKIAIFLKPGYTRNIACDDRFVDRIVNIAVARGDALVQTVDLRYHTARILGATRVGTKSDGTKYYDFTYNLNIDLPDGKESEHIEIVSYMHLDIEKMKADKFFQVSKSGEAQIRSLMNLKPYVQKVKERNEVLSNTLQFYIKGTNTPWTGPVHYHPTQGYMGGAQHVSAQHPQLEARTVPNVKVLNNNGVKEDLLAADIAAIMTANPYDAIDRLNNTSTSQNIVATAITEPSVSKNEKGEASFVFHVNVESIIKANSSFPGLQASNVYRRAPIESIRVFRQRANPRSDQTALGVDKVGDASRENQPLERQLIVASSDNIAYGQYTMMGDNMEVGMMGDNMGAALAKYMGDESLRDVSTNGLKPNSYQIDKDFDGLKETNVGDISEIDMTGASKVGSRTFVVNDFEISEHTSGKFRYMVEIEFKDPTILYLNRKLAMICMVKEKLEEVLNFIDQVRGYDDNNGRYTNQYIRQSRKHNTVAKDVAVEMSKFLALVGLEDAKTRTYMLSNLSIQSGSPTGIRNVLEIIDSVEQRLIQVLGRNIYVSVNNKASAESNSKISNSTNVNSGLIVIEKQFNEIIDKDNGSALKCNYFNVNGSGFPVMTKTQYAALIATEKRKYANADKGIASTDDQQVNLSMGQLKEYNRLKSDYQYLTANRLTAGTGQSATVVRLSGENAQKDMKTLVDNVMLMTAQSNQQIGKVFSKGEDGILEASNMIAGTNGVIIDTITNVKKQKLENLKNFTVDAKETFGNKNNLFDVITDLNLDDQQADSAFIKSVKKKMAVVMAKEQKRRMNKFGDVSGPIIGNTNDGGKDGNRQFFGPLLEKNKNNPQLDFTKENFILKNLQRKGKAKTINIANIPPSYRDRINKIIEVNEDECQDPCQPSKFRKQKRGRKKPRPEQVPVVVEQVPVQKPPKAQQFPQTQEKKKIVTQNVIKNLDFCEKIMVKVAKMDMQELELSEGDQLDAEIMAENVIITGGCDPYAQFEKVQSAIREEDNAMQNIVTQVVKGFNNIPNEFTGITYPCRQAVRLQGRYRTGMRGAGRMTSGTAGQGQTAMSRLNTGGGGGGGSGGGGGGSGGGGGGGY